jgi:hypothetical protein
MGRIRGVVRLWICLLALAAGGGAVPAQGVAGAATGAAQVGTVTSVPEVPFVSRLVAQSSDGAVKLTWQDSPDVVGTCLVYRSAAPIAAPSLASAALVARVPSGVQEWTDSAPGDGTWYYAIVMEDARGTQYPLLVPYRNVTTKAVAAAVAASSAAPQSPVPASAPARTPSPESTAERPSPTPEAAAPSPAPRIAPAEPAPSVASGAAAQPTVPSEPARITAIAASLSSSVDAAIVSFNVSNPARSLLLFRGNAPMVTALDLLQAQESTPLAPGTSMVSVSVLPGKEWWFAVVDAELYRLGQAPLTPGANTTIAPLVVPEASPASVSRRPIPLPPLGVDLGVLPGAPAADSYPASLPLVRNVSADAERAIQRLLAVARKKPRPAPTPDILPGDLGQPTGGDAGRLLYIIQWEFQGGRMTAARQQLVDFLSQPRSPEVAAHARFYLGQSALLLGDPQEALIQLLLASDYYYRESQPWIDAAIDELVQKGSEGR